MLHKLILWYRSVGEDPALARAQALRLHRQVPLLYGLLLINSVAIAATYWSEAPRYLTLTVPIFLFGGTLARMIHWLRVKPATSLDVIRKQLKTPVLLAAVLGTAYVTWALALSGYGGPFKQAHVALYVSTTVIGCIFCLVHLPQAAVMVAVCVLPAFLITFVTQHYETFAPLAFNVVFVLLVLLRVLFNSFESFRQECAARTELARLNAENRAFALTDALTGLNNRRSFYDDLARITSDAASVGTIAVGLLDLDRFKPVNDMFGHHVGDQLLVEVAHRLRVTAAPHAQLYRLGGDEFAMIVTLPPQESTQLAERMCQAVAAPVRLADRQIAVGVSIGLAPLLELGLGSSELAERADYALYHAKRNRAGRAVLFSHALQCEIRQDHSIQVELQSSGFEDELDVQVQPIVHARTSALVGGEILVRWNSERLGRVEPERFITVAERSALIHRITLNVTGRALDILRTVPSSVAVSVNISACDINSPETVAAILRAIAQSGQDPARFWIEVTETAVMRDMDAAIDALRRFRTCGVRVALDDFGTGYSSLSNLHRLPLDKVKIDRSFVHDLQDNYSNSIAKAVVGLCGGLGLRCIAEGVETEGQARILRDLGCDLLQGYLFSRPISAAQFAQRAAGWNPDYKDSSSGQRKTAAAG